MAPEKPKRSPCTAASLFLVSLVLAACSTTPALNRDIPPLESDAVFEAEDRNPLEISAEMAAFVELWARDLPRGKSRAWSLAYAVMDPFILEFDYDPRVTLTAAEAFEQRTGNCLTFSNLFIALAREAGIEAWYREVKALPEWESVNDTALVSMHTNAGVRDRYNEYVIDVSRRQPAKGERVRRLNDQEAKAQYFNNLGADALVEDDLGRAYAWFVKALDTWPDLAYVWSNLGVVYRRNGQTPDAIRAYELALQIAPDHSVSLNNLYVIYEEDGDAQKAEEMAARVEKIRRRNPYYLLHLASVASEEQRYLEAQELLARAIRIDRHEYRFYRELAEIQFKMGEFGKARSSLDQARQLAPKDVDAQSITLPPMPEPPDS
jgi:tetratricopeptide (TPR) repeat protein